ncbi:hypothetical protein IHE45_04G047700 [Dioscorea alata]|uniref:Uncharacterized protein n=1 Tax=Dioscorea alata TaxID=55571 RepID=A0ACB7WCQ0_DIOAL|nr:hypothetical protein IHE45_04G047700 [Dioscorea alata]
MNRGLDLLSLLLKYIIDEGVDDAHGLAGDPDIKVDLFENLEYVDVVGLASFLDLLFFFLRDSILGQETFPGLGFHLSKNFLSDRLLRLLLLRLHGFIIKNDRKQRTRMTATPMLAMAAASQALLSPPFLYALVPLSP